MATRCVRFNVNAGFYCRNFIFVVSRRNAVQPISRTGTANVGIRIGSVTLVVLDSQASAVRSTRAMKECRP